MTLPSVFEVATPKQRCPVAGRVIAVALGLALLGCVIESRATFAQEMAEVELAFDEGRYEEALPALRVLAERGQSEAQHLLAVAYRDGLGLTGDAEIAAVWFERAAASGHAPSQFALAIAYLRGNGVETSGDQAVRWLSKAADAGQADAAAVLASILLAQGKGAEARDRLRQAATAGHLMAAVQLGSLLEAGVGGEADRETAAEWYRRAGQGGEPEGVYRWALLTADGPDARVAVMQRSAEAGYPLAQYELAAHLLTAGGETAEGIAWLTAAAESGLSRAQHDLAIAYRDGIGTAKDDEAFRLWITKAAEAGFPDSQYGLAVALTDATHGFEADYERAFSLYSAAAAHGMVEALYGLAYLLSHGFGVQQDFAQAAEKFQTAAEAGHVPSQVALGNLYANGKGVAESRYLAEKWYCEAARSGQKDVLLFLGGEDEIDAMCSGHGQVVAPDPQP